MLGSTVVCDGFLSDYPIRAQSHVHDDHMRDFNRSKGFQDIFLLPATRKLLDGSEATVFLARTLTLECPRGQTGFETITHEGPTRLPEAMRAVQSGKLPRKVGVTVVRHDVQYEFTLHAETLAIGGAKIPPPDDEDERARLEARGQQLRDLNETFDLIFDAFGRVRFSAEWSKQLAKMQKWLSREDRRAA